MSGVDQPREDSWPRWTRTAEASPVGAAGVVGVEPWTATRWDVAPRAAAHACAVRQRHPPMGRGWNTLPGEHEYAMTDFELHVNGERRHVSVDPSTPILWVLREELKMTGTKYGCGIGACGACTIHLDGIATRSCLVPVSLAGNRQIVTIEGMANDRVGRAVQDAWVGEDVVQCGYCQSGQIMTAAALLKEKPRPTDVNIEQSMGGNLCRCGTYVRIRRAIKTASVQLR
jgi:isoquinoline 1-oxidoreductase alpha subunit